MLLSCEACEQGLVLNAGVARGYPLQVPSKLFNGEPGDFAALKGCRVGVLSSWLKASHPEVSEVCTKAISELREAGLPVITRAFSSHSLEIFNHG